MTRKTEGEPTASLPDDPDDVRATVRRAARALADRHETLSARIADDPDFQSAVDLLVSSDLTPKEIAGLMGESSPFLTAIAVRALTTRGAAPPGWERRVVRRLAKAGPGEIQFLLEALAHLAQRPVIANVLERLEERWFVEPVRPALDRFLLTRADQGERVETSALRGLNPEQHVLARLVLQELDDERLQPLAEALRQSDPFDFLNQGDDSSDTDFFREFARSFEAPAEEQFMPPSRRRVVDSIVAAMTADPPRPILLVGERGSGKSVVVKEVARLLGDEWFAFEASASELIAGQMYTGMVDGRIQEIAERSGKNPILWVFPNFEEAFWAGQWSRSPRGVLDSLLPYLDSGAICIVGELEPAAYELLVRMRPKVATVFEALRLPPLDEAESLSVGRAWADTQARVGIDDEALLRAQELSDQFLPGIAAPGGLLRLLQLAWRRAEHERQSMVTAASVLSALSEWTGLPLHLLDPEQPLRPEEVRSFFLERVLGQPEAVECLIERIAMIKAGLTDAGRPLGVFLFAGPTGTGKTEIAKTLAAYLFGSEERLIRLDMSEYQTPDSLERLLAEDRFAEASSLIASVRRQPFSVVLLDEFEKAHPKIWDLFLQVFDDGRLTDQNGRVADFRQCVVILTSNIGSAIPSRAAFGFSGEHPRFDPSTVERAIRSSFRPELLNRLDRVVVFRPLEREVMREILQNELSAVLRRRGFRDRPWAVEWDDAAVEFLLEQGFTGDLGARPLKRAIERYLLSPLALAIVEHHFPEGDQFLFITARDGERLDVSFVDPDADVLSPPAAPSAGATPQLEALVIDPRGEADAVSLLVAEHARISSSVAGWLERKDDALRATREPGFWHTPDRGAVLALVEYLDRLGAAMRTADGLLRRLRSGRSNTRPAQLVQMLAQRLYLLDRAVAGLDARQAADAVIALSPSSDVGTPGGAAFAEDLIAMYIGWARKRGMRFDRLSLDGGQAIVFSGLGAYTILAPEAGLHSLEVPKGERGYERASVLVEVAPLGAGDAETALEDRARQALAGHEKPRRVVRRYRRDPSPLVRDSVRGWRSGRLGLVLAGDFDVIL